MYLATKMLTSVCQDSVRSTRSSWFPVSLLLCCRGVTCFARLSSLADRPRNPTIPLASRSQPAKSGTTAAPPCQRFEASDPTRTTRRSSGRGGGLDGSVVLVDAGLSGMETARGGVEGERSGSSHLLPLAAATQLVSPSFAIFLSFPSLASSSVIACDRCPSSLPLSPLRFSRQKEMAQVR